MRLNNRFVIGCLFFILLGSFKIHSQALDSLIIWDKNYKLSWSDFLGTEILPQKKIGALSLLEIHNVKTYYKNEILYHTVIPVFNRNKSVAQHFSCNLLEHEQLHFDIQELFSRKIRKAFLLLDLNNACEISYDEIFKIYSDQLCIYQKEYDSNTNFSLRNQYQKNWSNKIAIELKKLEAFSIENVYGIKVEN